MPGAPSFPPSGKGGACASVHRQSRAKHCPPPHHAASKGFVAALFAAPGLDDPSPTTIRHAGCPILPAFREGWGFCINSSSASRQALPAFVAAHFSAPAVRRAPARGASAAPTKPKDRACLRYKARPQNRRRNGSSLRLRAWSARSVGVDCDGRGAYFGIVREIFRPLMVAALLVALAAYALDCGAMTTPEQAMQCCSSMPCAPQGHNGSDCCKSMPSMHAPFVQLAYVHSRSHGLAAIATLAASDAAVPALSESERFSTSSHAPPLISPPPFLPLRI